jgi:iron complex outermembrane receptor protein
MKCVPLVLMLLASTLGAASALGSPSGEKAPARALAKTSSPVSEHLVFEEIPIVITASRHEQKASEAPASVHVITSEEIRNYGYRTLAEALQSAPGIFISYDHSYTYIGVRGISRGGDYNSRVQLQLDGHPMNDNVWEQGFLGEDLGLDMNRVDRIEIVYGPGSALYGSNALFAIINVITRPPSLSEGAEIDLEGGAFGRAKAQARFSGRAGGWDMAASAGALNAGGDDLYFPEYDALGQNGGIAEQTDFEKAYRVSGALERGPFQIRAQTSYRVKGIPTGAYTTVFNDDASRTTDTRTVLSLSYRRTLREGLDLAVRGAYDEYRYWGTYRYDAGGGLLVDNIDRSTGRWVTQEAQLDYRISERHALTFGQGVVRNFDADVENFDEEPHFRYADVRRSFTEFSLFAQHEYAPVKQWRFTTGARYDDYSTFGSAVSPRFAAVYMPAERWRLKFLAGRAFRAPNIYELFYEAGTYAPNPALDPEYIASYELGAEVRLNPRFDLRLALYRDRIRDLISQEVVPPGNFQFLNLESAESMGGELALRTRFGNGSSGYFSYSYMRAENGAGEELTNYPPYTLKAGASVPLREDRWRISANLQYSQSRLMLTGARSPDVFLTNVTLLAPLFHHNARLVASVYNLFDRNYGLPASEEQQDLELIPQDGRTFLARLHLKF